MMLCAVLLTIGLFSQTSSKKYVVTKSDLVDDDSEQIYSIGGWSRLQGPDLLFDLFKEPFETTNVYFQNEYKTRRNTLLERAAYWFDQVAPTDRPDQTVKMSTWKKAGGVVPWLNQDVLTTPREIKQQFSNSDAPHIVIFLVDDWGWNDVGYQSTYMSWTTPNIDKLASSGIKLTNYFTHELCVPSRAALMTGRYPLRFGMHGAKDEYAELYLSEVTLAEELKSAGYRTNIVGKWHLGMSSLSKTPTYRGFDHFYGFLGGHVDYWTKKYGTHLDLHNDEELIDDSTALSEEAHSEFVYAAEAVRVINDHATNYANQPMFLYFSSQLMHTSWAAADSYVEQCADDSATTDDEQTYCAMSLMLDKVLTKITCALENNNMMDNTVFVMMSDNGGNIEGSSYPFRGAKGSMFRGGNSVPAFVVAPESLIPATRQGGEYAGQFHVTDWLPTLMGLATNGEWTDSYAGNTIDGVDMWDTIVANTDTKHTEIVHYLDKYGNVSVQIDMNKIVRYNASDLDVVDGDTPPHFFLGGVTELATCSDDETDFLAIEIAAQIQNTNSYEDTDQNSNVHTVLSTVLVLSVMLSLVYVIVTFYNTSSISKYSYVPIVDTDPITYDKTYFMGGTLSEKASLEECMVIDEEMGREINVGEVCRVQALNSKAVVEC